MKKNKINIVLGMLAAAFMMSSCYKKIDIPNTNTTSITLASGAANFITADVTVNPKDSIIFSYTISCPSDMKYVGIQKNATDNSTFIANTKDTLTSANKNSFTATKRLAADSANGVYKYRVVALDASGFYLGSKEIVITVKPDFNYYTVRVLQVPDTTDKVNTCYLAAKTGAVYSYTNGSANSANIDMGFYYDTTGRGTTVTTDDVFFSVYSLNAPQAQLSFYDISSWTKNNTIMKKATTPTFASLTSAGGLRSAAVTNLTSGATGKVTNLAAGNLVFFKTAAGKAGCMQVNYINGTDGSKSTYMNVDIKIEQ